MNLFSRSVQNGVDLDNEPSHHNKGAEGKAEKSKTMRSGIKRHDGESGDERENSNDHPLVIFFSEREFIHK